MIYKPFHNFIFRTPAFSLEKWQGYISEIQSGNYQKLLADSYFLEAVFMASPVLYNEMIKYKSGTLPKKEEERLFSSLLRYLTRMSWRCTPFGLFSACSVGSFSEKTDIILPENQDFKRHTRLDMNYLCALIQEISRKEDIKSKLKYYPNTSLYPVGSQLRYVEYTFKNAYRKHNIISVDNSEYLQRVLLSAQAGQTIDFLSELLVEEDISFDEAKEFILELIDSQVLISELEPAVTGKDVLDALIEKLTAVDIIQSVTEIQRLLQQANNQPVGNTLELYNKIIANIKQTDVTYDLKYLFQTDLIKPPIKAELSGKIADQVLEAISFLNRLTPTYGNPNLNNFFSAFYNRFEDKEMPLLTVLDNEVGIGYPVGKQGDISPLLAKFFIPNNNAQTNNQQIEWNAIQAVLHKKYLEAHKLNQYQIEISESDFTLQAERLNDTPDTLSAMCRIFSLEDEKALIYFGFCGGGTAASLLARFAHADPEIENHITEITQKEADLQKEAILAEIVHLPESRVGNIVFRPAIRQYEIPYLANSAVEQEFQIPLSDLYISIKNGQLLLQSKKLNKRIIPRLTNAHNYSGNSMPVYHFLCDMQTYSQRAFFGLDWNSLSNSYDFRPRIMYKNIIFSPARWIVKTEDLKKMLAENDMEKVALWRKEKLMPRYVFLPDGDNEFYVDMENATSIKNLLDVVKKRKSFYLEEFPFDFENALIRDTQNNSYTNEFIFSFYKSEQ